MVSLRSALEYYFERVLRSTALYADRMLTVDVIINLQAGRLSTEKRASATLKELDTLTRGLVAHERGPDTLRVRFHQTHYVGHAREIARELIAQPVPGAHLVVSAGGDGTHGEVLGAFAGHTARTSGETELSFIRLPFGTGNDGADAPDLPRAVRLLLGSAERRTTGTLLVRPVGMSEFSGYNIGSIGLDAYVAYLTNRLKGRFAGDLYKLLADVMTLFYERVVGAGRMHAAILDDRGRPENLEGVFLIFAVGVSGYRQYGGGKLVMPGYENLCAIDSLGLLGKLRLKSLFYRGEHIHEPNVSMRAVSRATVHYDRSIPLQIDGETAWLHPENFPLEFQVLPPEVPVLVYEPRAAQSKV